MATLNSNGVSINYRRVGDGADVVLIHGLAANHAFWHHDVLLPLVRRYRVTVYDLRGHGYSSMPPCGYTSRDMAGDLDRLLDHLGAEKAHLIGHSVGGVIALHYAALHPERVTTITVADSRVRTLQPEHRPRDWPNWPTARRRLEELGLRIPEDETDSGIWLLERLASPEWQGQRDKLKGTSLVVPFTRWGGGNRSAGRWLELLNTTTAREDLKDPSGLTIERLAEIRQPVLAMYGEKSPMVKSLRGLAEHLPWCETVIIPEAGHFFPLGRAALFVDKLSVFLEEHRAGGRSPSKSPTGHLDTRASVTTPRSGPSRYRIQ
jgi:pimeloyl-ACP methyl ester carboxylesterase